MKQGLTLQDLAAKIEHQSMAKKDFIAETSSLEFVEVEQWPQLVVHGYGEFIIGDHAHRQIGDRVGIPAKYYDRMLNEAPTLLTANVNHWFQNKPEQRMVRTLEGKARAFLSNRYRPMDNFDLAEAVLPTLLQSKATVHSCEITEQRMYIKAVLDSVQEIVPPPDNRPRLSGYSNNVTISPGIVISNSEIGMGALAIQPAVHFLACTNMAVWARHALRKYHIGKNFGNEGNGDSGDDNIWEFLSDDTRKLTDAALWSQVNDLVKGVLEGDVFYTIVGDLRRAREEFVEADKTVKLVENLSDKKGLAKTENSGILSYLIDGGDLSKFGLSNAVTRYSQDVESYDRASFLEQLGGEVIALESADWRALVN